MSFSKVYNCCVTSYIHMSRTFLVSAASRPGRFIPEKRSTDAHSVRGWVGTTEVLYAVEKRNFTPAGTRTITCLHCL
jgi:hypothetical protein